MRAAWVIFLACTAVFSACATDRSRPTDEAAAQVPEQPDEVILDNGDRLTGTIRYLTNQRVGLVTGYAGIVDVDWRSVTGFTSHSTITIFVTSGESYRGTASMDGEGRILIRTSQDQEPMVIEKQDIIGSTRAAPGGTEPAAAPEDEYTDVIILDNGDRISGILEGKQSTRVNIETRHSDVIDVRWSRVVEIETEFPIRVSMIDGTVVEGRLDLNVDGFLTVYVEGEAPLRVHRSQVSRMDRRSSRLEGDIVISVNATEGNTDNFSSLLKWDLLWKGSVDTITFRGNSSFSSLNDTTTEENLYSQLRYDYLFQAGTYVFGSAELNHDEFQNVKVATTYTLGGGYELVQQNWLEIAADLGLSYTKQSFDEGSPTDDFIGGRAGVRLKWELPLSFEIRDTFTYFPNFQEGEDWRIRNELVLDRSVYRGWRLQTGIITSYMNEPRGTAVSNSNTIYLGLGYRF